MSRKDIEELIRQLQDAAKDAPDQVVVERSLFNQALEGLGRLEQALDNRPSLIKKLNEKITKLESELEILRNETRVNELEKKVQRLEGELQRSYATKNFTLKNGLLEIEKAYRDFISASPAVQSLWDEITLLLVEDKESLPQHILARRNQITSRGPTADHSTDHSAAESPLGPHVAVAAGGAGAAGSVADSGDLHQSTSYVQQQVDKFKDYTFTPGPHDLLDPNHPANQHHPFHHLYFPGGTPAQSYGGVAPDARAADVVNDRPMGLENLSQLREQYDEAGQGGAGLPASQWGSLVPEPSPLRPVSLFIAGGEAGRAPDASSMDAYREELSVSLDKLRALFAQYDWAPTPQQQPAGGRGGEDAQQGAAQRRLPDASAITTMADSLEVSVERLREYFSHMHWVPGAPVSGSTSQQQQGAGPAAAITPDARYFDAQAEVILASVQRLRKQFQDAAEAEAAKAAVAEAAAGSGGGAWSGGGPGGDLGAAGCGAGAKPAVVCDARYFETQADAIAASVDALLRLYERTRAGDATAAPGGGGGLSRGPWPAFGGAPAAAGARTSGPDITPDARAGEAAPDDFDASVRPLIDLFSAFMAHLEATQGSVGASGPWPLWWRGRPAEGAAAGQGQGAAGDGEEGSRGEGAEGGAGGEGAEQLPGRLRPSDLVRLFAQFARAWPAAAAAAAAASSSGAAEQQRPGAFVTTPSGRALSPMPGISRAESALLPPPLAGPDVWPSGRVDYTHGSGVAALGASRAASASVLGAAAATAAPLVRCRLRVNGAGAAGTDAVGGDGGGDGDDRLVTLHLSPVSSLAPLPSLHPSDLDRRWASASGPANLAYGMAASPAWATAGARPPTPQPPPAVLSAAVTLSATATAAAAAAPAGSVASSAPPGPATAAAQTPLGRSASTVAAAKTASAAAVSGQSPLEVLLSSLEARHGRGLATSPEAVAVWRDLLMLLGVDPNVRPLPRGPAPAPGGAAAAATPLRPRSGTTRLPAGEDEGAEGADAAAAWTAASAAEPGTAGRGRCVAADGAARSGTAARVSGGGGADEAAAAAAGRVSAWEHPGSPADFRNRAADATTAATAVRGGSRRGSATGEEAEGVVPEVETSTAAADGAAAGGGQGRRLVRSASAEAMLEGAKAKAGASPDGEGPEGPSTPEDGPRDISGSGSAGGAEGYGNGVGAAASRFTSADGRAEPEPGAEAEAEGEAEAAAAAVSGGAGPGGGDALSRPLSENQALEHEGEQGLGLSADEPHATSSSEGVADGADIGRGVGAAADVGDGYMGEEADAAGGEEAEAVVAASDGPGLVAGGVRFHITLSEITPAEEPAPHAVRLTITSTQRPEVPSAETQMLMQQVDQQQPLVQFRANVDGGGLDPAAAAATEAEEVEQLRQVHQSLSEQLAATQDLVLHLNHQLKGVLESREDLAARAERLSADLAAALADACEARQESDEFMRDLVRTKVQLAEVQGEYMQVYQAFKKALSNEKDMMAKIDELERILAVVGPGDVAVDEEYGSAVGHASAMATPRDDALPEAAPTPGNGAGQGDGHSSHGSRSTSGVYGRWGVPWQGPWQQTPRSAVKGLQGMSSGGRSASSGSGGGGSGGENSAASSGGASSAR